LSSILWILLSNLPSSKRGCNNMQSIETFLNMIALYCAHCTMMLW
jgi:hypothetical protein